jgi:hypothetical protein
MSAVDGFLARDGSGTVVVLADDLLAKRAPDGSWSRDFKDVGTVEDLARDFAPMDAAEASALLNEARMALSD